MAPQCNEVGVPWMDAESIKLLPVFLVKLLRMLEDESLDEMICWDPSGTSFHICDAPRFCDNVLPHYFKHRNLNSFVRQLNFYGFRKLAASDKATLTNMDTPSDDLHFIHPKFIRGRSQMMYEIKRQTNPTKKLTAVAPDKIVPANLEGQFVSIPTHEWIDTNNEVKDLRMNLDELQCKVEAMERNQDIHYNEIRNLREMNMRQSESFNKLLSCLVNMMNPAKKVNRRPRPYVDQSADNFMVATRNGGDMLSIIQREFQEGLHISKQSFFDEGNKDVQLEYYYDPEQYEQEAMENSFEFQNRNTVYPPNLENQSKQVAIRQPKQVYTYLPQRAEKKEIVTTDTTENRPSTSYTIPREPHYYEEVPLEFLEQSSPRRPSPLYFEKVEPLQEESEFSTNHGEILNNEALMEFFQTEHDGPLEGYLEGDGQEEWDENLLHHE